MLWDFCWSPRLQESKVKWRILLFHTLYNLIGKWYPYCENRLINFPYTPIFLYPFTDLHLICVLLPFMDCLPQKVWSTIANVIPVLIMDLSPLLLQAFNSIFNKLREVWIEVWIPNLFEITERNNICIGVRIIPSWCLRRLQCSQPSSTILDCFPCVKFLCWHAAHQGYRDTLNS